MLEKLIKSFVLFSMIFLLNISFIGNIVHAAEQNTTLSTNISSTPSSQTENKGLEDSKSSKDASTKDIKTSSDTSITEDQNKDNKSDKELASEVVDEKKEEEFIKYGWKVIDNKKYYIVDNKIYEHTGWFMEKDVNPNTDYEYEYLDAEYYLDEDFSVVVGWKKIGNNWHHFNSEGVMQTGWIADDAWYYTDNSGIMKTGWTKIDGYQYYFNQYGQMATGKKVIDNNWYFFNNSGRLEKGLYEYNGKTYYSDESGIMVRNKWIDKRDHKYYIKADSSIAVGSIVINGVMENFDENGYYQNSDNNDKNYLYIQYLNVGNADCAFIKLPSGETILIDTGDVKTSKTLMDFLDSQNLKTEFFESKTNSQATPSNNDSIVNTDTNTTINTNITKLNNGKPVIDYVVLTHPHSDHIGGMIELMKNYNVGKVIIPKYFNLANYSPSSVGINDKQADTIKYDYNIYKATMDALSKSGISIIEAEPESYIDSEGILQFLHINKDYSQIESDNDYTKYYSFNDNSAIIYLNYYDFQALFTGDMQWNSEKDFFDRKALTNKSVDILKIPHHGIVGSSSYTFIGYVNPTIGVMSRDKNSISTTNEPYTVLTTCGVKVYETSATSNGLSVYVTEDNWNIYDNERKKLLNLI